MSTSELILRLAVLFVALVCAGFAVLAVVKGGSDGGCLAFILGFAALVMAGLAVGNVLVLP